MTGGSDSGRGGYAIGQALFHARPPAPALYLVSTPIGNLDDITVRALETLAAADILACEDTRVTRKLLERYGIRRRTVAYHEHNAGEAGPRLLAALDEGKSVALVSDAGTPLISDPGYRLVSAAQEAGHRVVPLPGASAALAALVASGLPTDRFCFAGFLPGKSKARRDALEKLRGVAATLVFYESPRRLAAALDDMATVLGERAAVVARELTKLHEEFRRGTLAGLGAAYRDEAAPKGEVVICVAPPGEAAPTAQDVDALLASLATEMPAAKAAAEAARMSGLKKADLYRRLLELKDDNGDG